MLSVTPTAVHHRTICPATSSSAPADLHHSGRGRLIPKSCRDELNESSRKFRDGDDENISFIRKKRLNAFYSKKEPQNDENVSIESTERKLTSPRTRKNSVGEKRKRDAKPKTPKSVKFARMPGILRKPSPVKDEIQDEKSLFADKNDSHEADDEFTNYEYQKNDSSNFYCENPSTEDSAAAAEKFLSENEEFHFPPINDWNDWELNENIINPGTEDIFVEPLVQQYDMPYYLIGFPNPPGENRCWLNATLQALFALPLLEKFRDIDINDCSKLTKTLVALQIFWKEGSTEKEKTHQTVLKFKNELSILDSSYPSERQQDVSEFLMIFLNHIQTDCEKILSKDQDKKVENRENALMKTPTKSPSKRPPLTDISPFKRQINFSENLEKKSKDPAAAAADDNDEENENDNNNNDLKFPSKNPIDEVFLLHMMEHYVCRGCSNHRQRKIDNLMLYVDLPENETDSVDLTCSIIKSMETEERTLTCSKCKSPNQNVYTSFRKLPNILIVQIKRYAMTSDGYVAKINTPVKIPEILTLGATSNGGGGDDDDGNKYVPLCMIAHVGAAMDCGHYTSYVKHDEQWYHYNDLHVTPMTSSEALNAAETTAYVVFYVNSNYLTQSTNTLVTDEPLR